MCLGAIYWARLARIYFGNVAADASRIGFDDSFIYQEFRRPLPQRSIPMVPMMREQALDAFRAWQEKPTRSLTNDVIKTSKEEKSFTPVWQSPVGGWPRLRQRSEPRSGR